jgi:hypothetical protein
MKRALWFPALAAVSSVSAQISSMTLPQTAPSDAPVVDPTFPSFAFEERSFYLYFGSDDAATKASRNLVTNVAKRTNGTTVIRVGGTSL